eukprot:s290_g8.t1
MNLSANPAKLAFFKSLPEAACQAIVLLKLWSCGASANEMCRVYENAAERRWPVTDCKLKIAGYPLSMLAAAVSAGNREAGIDSSPCRILVDVLAILASSVSKPLLVLRNGTTTSADGPATATEVFHQLGVRRKAELEPSILVQDAFYDDLFFKVGPMPLDKIRRQAASTFFRISTICDLGKSFRWSSILASGSSEQEDAAMMPHRLGMLSVAFAELWPLDAENEAFWLSLVEAAAAKSLAGQLSAADAANCGVAFAATQLPAEQLTAALQLSQYAEEADLSPQTCCALLLTHAYAGLWAPRFLEAMTKQIPDLLWQATDRIVCRWALASYLSGGRLTEPLREAVTLHVLRQAKALEAGEF